MPKIGLEIHQRLDTSKLFCRCREGEDRKKSITRELNITSSEMFEKDKAALFEEKKKKKFIYEFGDDVCLVELDEEPILNINKEALLLSIAIAKKLGMEIFDKGQVMRKIVIDGSNTSGFQRTMLIAIDGKIKGVGIETLCLEEESAGIIKRENEKVYYDLNRLGIPLIEIATEPTIKNGKQAKEIAEEIGMLLRMSGKVKRGIGTIRQDLNISVEGGNRVEIKGAQELELIESWVENEIRRQGKLIEIIKILKERNAYKKIKKEFVDVSKAAFSGFPKKAVERGEKLIALKLDGHEGILGREINPNRRYGTELSDYAKQAGVKGIIHSDEDLNKYGIKRGVINELLKIKEGDGFVIVVEKEEKAKKALEFVYERAKMDYVPKEVRKTLKNGSTAFLRPLPGKARMYPETDSPIIELNKIKNQENIIILSKEEMKERLSKELKNREIINKLIKSKFLHFYLKSSVRDKEFFAYFITDIIENIINELDGKIENAIFEIQNKYEKGEITKKGAKAAFEEWLKKGMLENILKKYERIRGKELLKIVEEYNYNIKEIMKKYSLRIDGKELKDLIKNRNEG